MAGRENRQCPHFDIHNGVCGCPEFWIAAQRPQNARHPSTLQETTNTRSDRNTAGNQSGSCASHSPPLDRTSTKTQPVTPAPPGPPKETCFFWYHGSCRRGDDCDRPHEAHPTWPIPCMLPLCPLRADLGFVKKPQEYQRRGRTIGGQMDGAAFSRATTSGESSSDNESSSNTNTDTSETDENTSTILNDHIVDVPAQFDFVSQVSARDARGEEIGQEGEVKLRQEIGSHESDESDYVDLSQLLFPPSTLFVQEESSLSISHPGTLGKRRQSPPTHSPDVNNKRVNLAKDTPPDLSNVISILERPRNMPLWDIKPCGSGTDRSHLDAEAAHLTLMHSSSPQPIPMFVAKDDLVPSAPQLFDPPKGPRSASVLPPICFFFYHKGYCSPKRGRRCDYLHNMNTAQQTVSLPSGIENHDLTCPLQLCPIRLQYCNRKGQEPALPAANTQPGIKHKSTTSPDMSRSSSHENMESSPHAAMTTMQGRYPKVMLGQPLPQPTSVARQRSKERKREMDQKQFGERVGLTDLTATFGSEHRIQEKKKARRRGRRGKKRSRANAVEPLRLQLEEVETVLQGRNSHSDAFCMQRSLPTFPVKEESSTPTVLPPVGDLDKTRREPENRHNNPLQSQHVKKPHFETLSENKGIRGSTVEAVQEWTIHGLLSSSRAPATPNLQDAARAETQNDINKALEMLQTVSQGPCQWWLLSINPQKMLSETIVAHEYSQESLGLTREERWTAIREEQRARREAFHQRQKAEREEEKVAREKTVHPEDSVTSLDKAAVNADRTTEYRLPEGDQRLDWDTDLVRRLFGEIE